MQCQEAIHLLHDLIDDDIEQNRKTELQQHLTGCSDCRLVESSLRETVALLQAAPLLQAPAGFTAAVMSQLPKTRIHSLARAMSIAAALLLLLVSPLYFSDTLSNPQLICNDRGASIAVEEGNYVVPVGEVVEGNITVYRSNLLVRGQVLGDVRVVDGKADIQGEGSVSGVISEQKSNTGMRLKLALSELWEDIGSWLFFRQDK